MLAPSGRQCQVGPLFPLIRATARSQAASFVTRSSGSSSRNFSPSSVQISSEDVPADT